MCNIQGSDLCAYTPDQCWAPTAGGEVGEQSLQQALHYYNIYIYIPIIIPFYKYYLMIIPIIPFLSPLYYIYLLL